MRPPAMMLNPRAQQQGQRHYHRARIGVRIGEARRNAIGAECSDVIAAVDQISENVPREKAFNAECVFRNRQNEDRDVQGRNSQRERIQLFARKSRAQQDHGKKEDVAAQSDHLDQRILQWNKE